MHCTHLHAAVIIPVRGIPVTITSSAHCSQCPRVRLNAPRWTLMSAMQCQVHGMTGNHLSGGPVNQSCGDARNPNMTSSSSCTQVTQYRIPDGFEFMKFSVRIPILNFRTYSAQVQVTPENSESTGILVLHSDSQTYSTDE